MRQLGDRPAQHGGEQRDAELGQPAQGRIVGGQPLAIARRRAAEGKGADAGARPEDIEDETGTGKPGHAGRGDEPAGEPEQGDAGGERHHRQQDAQRQRPRLAAPDPNEDVRQRPHGVAVSAIARSMRAARRGSWVATIRLAPCCVAAISASVTFSAVAASRSAVGSSARMTSAPA